MNPLLLHRKKVQNIASQIKRLSKQKNKQHIRFTHGSTNATRVQDKSSAHLIDITELNTIISIDTKTRLAIVEPNVPMDQLVDACLAVGLLPKVVMEFPGITCGGGVNGAALEASSFRYGQFNDTCLEYEIILGNGKILTTTKKSHTDLFYGVSGSYGSIALVTCITLELIQAKPYVTVSLTPIKTEEIIDTLVKQVQGNFDYIEGLIFDTNYSLLITGTLSEKTTLPVKTFSKAHDEWFYLFAKQHLTNPPSQFAVPIKEYLFRYNRGAFWMGQHAFTLFHTPFNRITRFLLNPFFHTRTMYKHLHATNIAQTLFIQDFYIPLSKTKRFLRILFNELPIFPLWLCPIKSTNTPQKLSPHYLKEKLLIDVGIWGPFPQQTDNIEKENKKFEKYVTKYGGRKMFYAESFYSKEEFWEIYDKKWYIALRNKYKAADIFPTIWQKITVTKRFPIDKKKVFTTILKTFFH